VCDAASVMYLALRGGIRDGLNGAWMFKFGAITELPDERDLPFSICVDRSDLQGVLLKEIGDTGIVQMGSSLSSYRNNTEEDGGGVTAVLEDGKEVRADVLVGADGIWSQAGTSEYCPPSRP